MYAIVLAGGYATRLWPLTKGTPKALLPIAGKPILEFILDKLQSIKPPFEKIIVSTNTLFQPQFESWLLFSGYQNVDLIPDIATNEKEKPGAVKAMANIIWSMPDDDVLVMAGDGMFLDDLMGFVECFSKKRSTVVAIYEVKTLEQANRGATVLVDNTGEVVDFIEKPDEPKTKRVCGAVYIFKKGIKQQLSTYLGLKLSSDQPGKFIEWLYRQEPVYGYMLSDPLWDIGTPEAYKACDEYFTKTPMVCKEIE